MSKPHTEALAHFDRIVELDRAERAAAVAALDAPVAAAVLELLRADEARSGVLDRGVQAFATDLLGAEDATASGEGMLKAHDVIGAFVVQRLLGRGGMGEVWLAERKREPASDSFVQAVALKVLKRGMDSDAMSARFVQERKILAELNHPHFARFIDGGVSADGRLYFAMEYVDGVNLIEHASAKNLSVRERVRLLADVCEAVAYAQNHLVVHRDLKPSNILVDSTGAVRVLDFGIAKLLGERAPNDTLTHTGVHALSPAYAAPEQVLGQTINTATDVYALGVILFELITGTLPHTRNRVSYEALIAQVHSEQTPIPSQALRKLVNTGTSSVHHVRALREVSGDLDTIILTALKREPARRYASAAALADDLRRWLDARPIAAQPDSRSYRVKKFVARNRLMVGSASGVLLALIAGLALALWQAGIAREQAKLAKLEFERAEAARIESDRIINFIRARMGDGDPKINPQGANLLLRDWMEQSLPKIQTSFADAPRAQIRLGSLFSSLLMEYGRYEMALTGLNRAVALSDSLWQSLPAEQLRKTASGLLAEPRVSRARVLSGLGRYAESSSDLQVALERLSQLPVTRETRLLVINANTTLLTNANRMGRYREALAIARKNLADRSALFGSEHPRLAVDLNNLGSTLARLGMFKEAKLHLQKSRDLLALDSSSPKARTANIDLSLANIAMAEGELDLAQTILAQAEDQLQSLLGDAHPDTLSVQIALAKLAMLKGESQKAGAALTNAMPKIALLKPHWLGDALQTQAHWLITEGRYLEAEAVCESALGLADKEKKSLALQVPPTSQVLRALAIAKQSKPDGTWSQTLANLEQFLKNPDAPAISKGDSALLVSAVLMARGQPEQAQAWMERALRFLQESMSPQSAKDRAHNLLPRR
jgi:eukaryotic-like serine/threonine-protein kinase